LLKRVIDFVGSAIALIVLSPLMIGVAILLKFTSEGSIFFRQTRVGLNKRMFNMYKFRTMIPNAEEAQAELISMNEMSGPVFKIKNDPRLTPIGKFLRRTSIDELPQLFNVLRGDMSLVGPRPMAVRDFEGFNEDWQRLRFSVRPGITCLWQISGRNLVPFQKWMELDMQYIEHWTLWLDLKILARTIPAVLKGTGAA
jgi:exopolysaccharide biosynthesis polyprenyl glycosylphosphotransferase